MTCFFIFSELYCGPETVNPSSFMHSQEEEEEEEGGGGVGF
jgi:hypothetical protein